MSQLMVQRNWFYTAYLQITKLRELLATVIKLASERLDLLVNDLVCSDVTTLSKSLAADVTAVRPLSRVASLVCLSRSVYVLNQRSMELTLRLPSWEKDCPHPGALQFCMYNQHRLLLGCQGRTHEGLCSGMCAYVDLKVRLLVEALVAVRYATLIPFPWL